MIHQPAEGSMNLLEIITQVRAFLEENGRISYRMLQRQFALDEEALEDIKEELIDVQQVAADDGGKVLVWLGSSGPPNPALPRASPRRPRPGPCATPPRTPRHTSQTASLRAVARSKAS